MIKEIECVTATCDGIRPDGRPCGADLAAGLDWAGWSPDNLQEELSDADWLTLPDGRHLCEDCVDTWCWLCYLLTRVPS